MKKISFGKEFEEFWEYAKKRPITKDLRYEDIDPSGKFLMQTDLKNVYKKYMRDKAQADGGKDDLVKKGEEMFSMLDEVADYAEDISGDLTDIFTEVDDKFGISLHDENYTISNTLIGNGGIKDWDEDVDWANYTDWEDIEDRIDLDEVTSFIEKHPLMKAVEKKAKESEKISKKAYKIKRSMEGSPFGKKMEGLRTWGALEKENYDKDYFEKEFQRVKKDGFSVKDLDPFVIGEEPRWVGNLDSKKDRADAMDQIFIENTKRIGTAVITQLSQNKSYREKYPEKAKAVGAMRSLGSKVKEMGGKLLTTIKSLFKAKPGSLKNLSPEGGLQQLPKKDRDDILQTMVPNPDKGTGHDKIQLRSLQKKDPKKFKEILKSLVDSRQKKGATKKSVMKKISFGKEFEEFWESSKKGTTPHGISLEGIDPTGKFLMQTDFKKVYKEYLREESSGAAFQKDSGGMKDLESYRDSLKDLTEAKEQIRKKFFALEKEGGFKDAGGDKETIEQLVEAGFDAWSESRDQNWDVKKFVNAGLKRSGQWGEYEDKDVEEFVTNFKFDAGVHKSFSTVSDSFQKASSLKQKLVKNPSLPESMKTSLSEVDERSLRQMDDVDVNEVVVGIADIKEGRFGGWVKDPQNINISQKVITQLSQNKSYREKYPEKAKAVDTMRSLGSKVKEMGGKLLTTIKSLFKAKPGSLKNLSPEGGLQQLPKKDRDDILQTMVPNPDKGTGHDKIQLRSLQKKDPKKFKEILKSLVDSRQKKGATMKKSAMKRKASTLSKALTLLPASWGMLKQKLQNIFLNREEDENELKFLKRIREEGTKLGIPQLDKLAMRKLARLPKLTLLSLLKIYRMEGTLGVLRELDIPVPTEIPQNVKLASMTMWALGAALVFLIMFFIMKKEEKADQLEEKFEKDNAEDYWKFKKRYVKPEAPWSGQ